MYSEGHTAARSPFAVGSALEHKELDHSWLVASAALADQQKVSDDARIPVGAVLETVRSPVDTVAVAAVALLVVATVPVMDRSSVETGPVRLRTLARTAESVAASSEVVDLASDRKAVHTHLAAEGHRVSFAVAPPPSPGQEPVTS